MCNTSVNIGKRRTLWHITYQECGTSRREDEASFDAVYSCPAAIPFQNVNAAVSLCTILSAKDKENVAVSLIKNAKCNGSPKWNNWTNKGVRVSTIGG